MTKFEQFGQVWNFVPVFLKKMKSVGMEIYNKVDDKSALHIERLELDCQSSSLNKPLAQQEKQIGSINRSLAGKN